MKPVASTCGVPHPFFDLVQKMQQPFPSLSYLDAVTSLVATRIAGATESDEEEVDARVKTAKLPGDVNVRISEVARRLITIKKTKIDVAGPLFTGV